MKKTLAMLAGACFALGLLFALPIASHAQAASGPFADVPADHWAYQAVDTLQRAGIVIGYPDGTYGGKRAMTRYEFAVAIARLLPLIKTPDLSDYATKEDLAAADADLENKLAANQDALDALKALVDEFQPELEKMGQDVADIRQRLDALEGRVAAVEAEQARVKITGTLDVIGVGVVGTSSVAGGGAEEPVVDLNGRPDDLAGSKHILQTDAVDENFALNIRGRVSDTATANVKLDFGDYIPSLGNTSTVSTSVGTRTFVYGAAGTLGANQDTDVREAYLDAPVSLGPLGGAELQVGRIPVMFDKYTLYEPDADQYTWLYETDSGNVPFDGGKLALKVGPVNLTGFAGTETSTPYSQLYGGSQDVNGLVGKRPTGDIIDNHAAPVTQGAGVRASFGSPDSIEVAGTLEEFGLGVDPISGGAITDPASTKANATYNKLTVYEGEVNGTLPFGFGPVKKGGIGVYGSFGESLDGGLNTNQGKGAKYNENTEQLKLQLGPVALQGGYQYVGPYYTAPGYWGTLGAWTNPTNVKGPVVSGNVSLGPKLSLKADGEWYDNAYGGQASPLQQNDKVNHYKVGLGYDLSSAYAVDLGYDDVLWDLKNNPGHSAGSPTESYLTLGIGHSFNSNASLKLLYQIIQYNDKGTGFDPGVGNGGLALGQFDVKF